jgi:hypothetical protein
MRIVNRAEFLLMPEGTLFSKYAPCWFDDLCIKDETNPWNDFWYANLCDAIACDDSVEFSRLLFDAQETGADVPMDFASVVRDGLFDADQLFAVWSANDVKALIAVLRRSVGEEVPR